MPARQVDHLILNEDKIYLGTDENIPKNHIQSLPTKAETYVELQWQQNSEHPNIYGN